MSLFPDGCSYDIVVLTEFFRLKDYEEFNQQFLNWEYATFIAPKSKEVNYNDVFIAIKKDYKPEQFSINLQLTYESGKIEDRPLNILGVKMYPDSDELSIIGLRFPTGDNNEVKGIKAQYMYKYKALEVLTAKLKDMYKAPKDRVIITGDFNNASIYGDEKEFYTDEDIRKLYVRKNPPGEPCDHQSYNYHVIKNKMKECGFELVTPEKGRSSPNTNNKSDHFAVKRVDLENVSYVLSNLSDHNQLVGEIK
jgi:hypothetical protein